MWTAQLVRYPVVFGIVGDIRQLDIFVGLKPWHLFDEFPPQHRFIVIFVVAVIDRVNLQPVPGFPRDTIVQRRHHPMVGLSLLSRAGQTLGSPISTLICCSLSRSTGMPFF